MVQKIFSRKNKYPEITVNEFCKNLVEKRLQKIAKAIPDQCYSMGSMVRVSFLGAKGIYSYDNRTKEYSKSCKYRPTHGNVSLLIKTAKELKNTHVIGGLVTYIEPGQKSKVKKCWWYAGKGGKQNWELAKVHGFICGNYHALTKKAAKEGFDRAEKNRKEYEKSQILAQKMFAAALRKQFTFQDSLIAGNCEAGTRAFILRCGLDINKKYRGKFLLETAKEKSINSVSYVERMVKSKML